jgi:Sensors of blue-light using FAD
MLVRLLYASHTTPALTDADMHQLLRQSRMNNPRQGITGLLCYSEGNFVQMLEGGREAVNRLYNRIAADPRHSDATLLSYAEVTERRFAGWSMGQVNLQRLNPGLLLKYSEHARLDPFSMGGAALSSLFEELVSAGVIVCN